jgi:hypothetical protein
MTDDAAREQLAALASAAIEELAHLAESGKRTAAFRELIVDLAAGAVSLVQRQDYLEAVMLGDDLGTLAAALIRRLTPEQLTDLGTRLLVAGS